MSAKILAVSKAECQIVSTLDRRVLRSKIVKVKGQRKSKTQASDRLYQTKVQGSSRIPGSACTAPRHGPIWARIGAGELEAGSWIGELEAASWELDERAGELGAKSELKK